MKIVLLRKHHIHQFQPVNNLLRRYSQSRMLFEGNNILLQILAGRVIDEENRTPLFLIPR